MTKLLLCASLLFALTLLARSSGQAPASPRAGQAQSGAQLGVPQYNAKSELLRPADYREWIYLSSGLGMNYNARAGGAKDAPQLFTNVFVAPWAYREFVATGKWPDKTMFVVEERAAESRGSINKSGHYQADAVGLGVEVKDAARYPERFAYFTFGTATPSAAAMPKAACWQCHTDHAAVENTFVQFYPTLKPVAQKFGVYREKP